MKINKSTALCLIDLVDMRPGLAKSFQKCLNRSGGRVNSLEQNQLGFLLESKSDTTEVA